MTGALSNRKALALVVGLLLTLTPFVQVLGATPSTSPSPATTPYTDYGLSALSSNDRITLASLRSWTGNDLTVGAFESYIEHDLIPYGIHQVLLDVGWQNYSAGSLPNESWVSNWLTACDVTGVQNVIYAGQLTTGGEGSPWIRSVISADPATQTYFANGTAAPFVSYDNPDVALFLEKDLATLYSYYGSYPSWVGIGTGSSTNDPYYQSGQLYPGLGYSNLTVSGFVNSHYYASEVNASGFLSSGKPDPLWTSLKDITPSLLMSSATGFGFSSAYNVYGNGSQGNFVEMRFDIPENLSSLSISWFGYKVGNPGPMVLDLYGDTNGSLDLGRVVASYALPSSSVSGSSGWQSGPVVPANVTAGYYWVRLSSPTSDSKDYYAVYMSDQIVNKKIIALAQSNYIGPGFQEGETILWVKNSTEGTVSLYPYQQPQLDNPRLQTFVANSTFSFNTVFLYLSDRIYNPVNATITVYDLTDHGGGLAAGLLSQQVTHGLTGWVPVSLNSTVTTTPGDTYGISLVEPNGGYSWLVALRGETTDPPSAGFQNQNSSWIFQLADLNWVQGHLSFDDMTSNGADAVTTGHIDAVRIMPSSNETLNSVSILMTNLFATGNYSSGNLTISVWSNNQSASTPSAPLDRGVTVQAKDVPTNGYLNITGINQPVVGGRYYWIVFSANSSQTFSFARFTNSYAFDVLVSLNGGALWQEPREGPTDFGFVASLTNQKLGNFILGRADVQLNQGGYFAEPFYANQNEQVSGVQLGQPPDCVASVSINPSAGGGHPSLEPMASGVVNETGILYAQFSSVADLQAGEEYWLVIRPISGTCSMQPFVYLPNAPGVPADLPSVVSQDAGFTWSKVSNTTSMLVYQLSSQPKQLPELSTSQLSSALLAYHSASLTQGRISGWTGYIAASEFSLFGNVVSWLNDYSGKNFHFYGQGNANVLDQLSARNQVLLASNSSTDSCSTLESALKTNLPLSGVQYYNVENISILSNCSHSTLGPVIQEMGYMQAGRSFGSTSSTDVLVVGDSSTDILGQYLSVAYNVTYDQLSIFASDGRVGNLSGYQAILWTSSDVPSASLGVQLARYVRAGGTLIFALFGGNYSSLNSLSGSLPVSNSTLTPPKPQLLGALVDHTRYSNISISSSATETIGNTSGLTIIARNYGGGHYYLAWFSQSEVNQISEPVVLLSNTVATSAALPEPFWYGADSAQSNPGVRFNVAKTPGGPLLVWLVNTGTQDATLSLSLNGSYYGVGSGWKLLDMGSMSVVTGSGSRVEIDGNLTAGSWMPVYVVKDTSAALIDYSNVQIGGQFVYPNQSFYYVNGLQGQHVLLMLSSNVTASDVEVDDNSSLSSLQSLGSFQNASSGWLYSGNSDTLFAKFVSDGPSSLRLLSFAQSSSPVVLPAMMLAEIFGVLVCAEIIVFAIVMFSRRKREEAQQQRRDHYRGV